MKSYITNCGSWQSNYYLIVFNYAAVKPRGAERNRAQRLHETFLRKSLRTDYFEVWLAILFLANNDFVEIGEETRDSRLLGAQG
jgi:hypothetical protein